MAVTKSQNKKVVITNSDRAMVYLELVDAHMEAGQLVRRKTLIVRKYYHFNNAIRDEVRFQGDRTYLKIYDSNFNINGTKQLNYRAKNYASFLWRSVKVATRKRKGPTPSSKLS